MWAVIDRVAGPEGLLARVLLQKGVPFILGNMTQAMFYDLCRESIDYIRISTLSYQDFSKLHSEN